MEKLMSQADVVKNLQRCPRFERCNNNLCPLDLELHLRYGGLPCMWMKEPTRKSVKGVAFVSGGKVMPDDLLRYVPKENVETLNVLSRHRWYEIMAPESPEPDHHSGESGSDDAGHGKSVSPKGNTNFEGHRVEEPQRVKATGVTKPIQTAEAVEGSNSCVSDCGSTRSLVVGGDATPSGQRVGAAQFMR